ncbi:BnaC06g13280D [Brassica napus]|uniref:BnaC06g13280D protein n=1 Tax=Brassica napus TaxID=3708 RepID=A0A078FBE6_BRANA|nr:BnaC06g13280D [Brassica napus]
MIITPTGQRNPFLHSWSCFPGLVMLSTSKLQTDKDLHLNGMAGQVHAMTVSNGMLFAGSSAKSKERKRLSAMVLQICVDMTVRVTVRALLFPSESHGNKNQKRGIQSKKKKLSAMLLLVAYISVWKATDGESDPSDTIVK